MKKVFVTGPDGLLGSNLVRELIVRGYSVRAMVLKGKLAKTLDGLDIDIVEGDVTNKDELITLSQGMDYFINVAAITDVWPSRGEIYHKVNVIGTENVIQAVLQNKIKRLIQVGSASSFGFGTKNSPGNEDSPSKSHMYGLDYIDSKRIGQEIVLEAFKKFDLPAMVVNPTFMVGPYDSKPSSGEMIIAFLNDQLPALSKGGKNWVYVKDVAHGIANGLEIGRLGETYILGHENLSFREALTRIGKVIQRKPPRYSVPNFLMKTVGMFGSAMATVTSKKPGISYPLARIACDGHYFSPAKAVEELKLPQTPIEIGVKEAVKWFEDNGYV